jgi:hypothetical protein
MAMARPLLRPEAASAERLRELAGVARVVRPVALAEERILPVLPVLEPLLVGGGLRRGSTVSVVGSTSLALALVAGPSAAGSWTAAVGAPALGVVAAAEAGIDLQRLALVADPGDQWATVTAALLDAVDVVMVRPARRVRQADARRLVARARERGSVLVPLAPWDGADVQLSIEVARWHGVGRGEGHLAGREVEVVATGRAAAARTRRASILCGHLPPRGGHK